MRFERLEIAARLLVFLVMIAFPLTVVFIVWQARAQVIFIRASMPENGGWSPGRLEAQVGRPLHIRLTSADVLHGFAVGMMDIPQIDVEPGKISEITLVFEQPGRYVFYCTRWCGPNHWRMRGTIEVIGGPHLTPIPRPTESLYVQLGLDIDADHHSEIIPILKPSAARGAALATKLTIPEKYTLEEVYLASSPEQLWRSIREEPWAHSLSAQEVWDLVAFIFFTHTTPQDLQQGKELYSSNCAACHGELGDGEGDMSDYVIADQPGHTQDTAQGFAHGIVRPSDFTDPKHMLAASPALLQGKIVRGGMGTGMPYWGPIFTDQQIWAIVAFLYSFQFDYGGLVNE